MTFWDFVQKTETCWLWTGSVISSGYGSFNGTLVHRSVMRVGKGYDVHHKCTNRLCVNPAHLEIVPHNNHPDGAAVERRQKTHCNNGHEYTSANTIVRPDGTRNCRICKRDLDYNRYHNTNKGANTNA